MTDEYYSPSTQVVQEEETMHEVVRPEWAQWGSFLLHTWLWSLGFILYSWYPSKIYSDSWWVIQCPKQRWNPNNLNNKIHTLAGSASGTVAYGSTPSDTIHAVNGTWNEQSCLNAYPIYWWNIQAWYLIIVNTAMNVVFLANFVWGNDSNLLSQFYLVTRQVAVLTSLLSVWFSFNAWNSYGMRAQVFNSWLGYPYAAVNSGTSAVSPGAANTYWTTNTSDLKYLMWKDESSATLTGKYALLDKLWQHGQDQNATRAFYLTVISASIDALFGLVAWFPNKDYLEAERFHDGKKDFRVDTLGSDSDAEFNTGRWLW